MMLKLPADFVRLELQHQNSLDIPVVHTELCKWKVCYFKVEELVSSVFSAEILKIPAQL